MNRNELRDRCEDLLERVPPKYLDDVEKYLLEVLEHSRVEAEKAADRIIDNWPDWKKRIYADWES
jgi:hypothetical protein